jgi:transposase
MEKNMRGRKAQPIPGLAEHDFAKLAKTEKNARQRIRFLAFAHIVEGKSFSQAARIVKVFPRTVINWVSSFRKDGINALKEQSGRGRKRRIEEKDEAVIGNMVEELQDKREGGRIRGSDVREIIKARYGVNLSNGSLYRVLHRAGLSWITGRSQHPKADIGMQENFKKNLKKKCEK